MASDKNAEDKAGMLKSLLHVDDVDKCGIDISEKLYLFESADGNLGLCAKVSDEGDVERPACLACQEAHCFGSEGAQRLSFRSLVGFVACGLLLVRRSS